MQANAVAQGVDFGLPARTAHFAVLNAEEFQELQQHGASNFGGQLLRHRNFSFCLLVSSGSLGWRRTLALPLQHFRDSPEAARRAERDRLWKARVSELAMQPHLRDTAEVLAHLTRGPIFRVVTGDVATWFSGSGCMARRRCGHGTALVACSRHVVESGGLSSGAV